MNINCWVLKSKMIFLIFSNVSRETSVLWIILYIYIMNINCWVLKSKMIFLIFSNVSRETYNFINEKTANCRFVNVSRETLIF